MSKYTLTSLLLLIPQIAQAAESKGFLDSLACVERGGCGLDDIGIAIALMIRMLLGLMGAVALLYFVWGGMQWLWSAGRQDRVKKGKDIMVNTVFALFIAFGSFIILDFFINRLLGAKAPFQVTDDCKAGSEGSTCNANFATNYVCNANLICVTACQYKSEKLANQNWQCTYVPYPDLITVPPYNSLYETGLCPGDKNNVCAQIGDNGLPTLEPPIPQPAP